MNGRGGDAPSANDGEYLLQLLRKPPNSNPPTPSPQQQPSQTLSQDPAVAAIGPSIPTFTLPHAAFSSNGYEFPYPPWNASPPFVPHNYFQQNPNTNPNLNPDFYSPPGGYSYSSPQFDLQFKRLSLGDATRKLDSYGDNSKPNVGYQQGQNLRFGSLNRDIMQNGSGDVLNQSLYENSHLNTFPVNSVEVNENAGRNSSVFRGQKQEKSSNCNARGKQSNNGSFRAVATPPGFSSNTKNVRNGDRGYNRGISDSSSRVNKNHRLANQLESPGLPAGSNLPSTSASDIEESMIELLDEGAENLSNEWQDKMNKSLPEKGDLKDELVDSLGLEDESGKKSGKKKPHRDKAYRSDKRGQWVADQSMRNIKRQMLCRNDINGFNAPLLDVFESLIPSDEEKLKQKQLLMLLEKLVGKEWPEARLYLYGSCANSFGFSKSDIDVCLEMGLGDIEKSKVLLKLADVFQSDNLQNIQALTRARVPIVKLMDPVTGISCDICINNILAVVNTKLLHDYARIDARLRQLAFIVKHWAKSRGVNETYHGTLSSYAYVLMCIHFLQQRRPPILPCLQRMQITYFATVENVECAFFDDVEKIQSFGSQNGETIAQLVWAFFHYWAYCHDYGNDVISVRTGSTLNKRAKYWTRRVGYDRHLICIEDPFDVSHDLGRVVDKKSIKILREEFERGAAIMQHDPNPCVALFEPYIPN